MESKSELKYIYSNVTDLLKFGEAKHAGLIILNSAILIGILTSYSTAVGIVSKPVILIGSILMGVSIFLSIASQFPITSNKHYSKTLVANPNVYFFCHLACLDEKQFIDIYKQIDIAFDPTKFDADLINQILVVSRICRAKFFYFKIASYLSALGVGIIGLSAILRVFGLTS